MPQASLNEVQIVPGGVSALYGSDALGGVVNLETRSAVQTAGALKTGPPPGEESSCT